jgi:putative aldouronate transport system substrate-binding protein
VQARGVLLLVTAIIAIGCSPASSSPAPASDAVVPSAAASEEPSPVAVVPITVASPCGSGPVADWSTDPILAELERQTNTDIEFQAVDWDAFPESINAGAAAGDIPDVIGVIGPDRRATLEQWARDGVIAPFTGDAAAAAPAIIAQYDADPSLAEIKVDGEPFFQPVSWGSGVFPNRGIIHIRKDLLDAYNLSEPQTFEELAAFIERAVAEGQGGLVWGGADIPGFSDNGALSAFAGAAGGPGTGWAKTQDGYRYWAVLPSTLTALQTMRAMFERGLVNPGVMELTADAARAEFVSGKAAALIFNGGGHIGRIQNDMSLVDPAFKEWVLPAPAGADGSTRGYTNEPQFWGFSTLGGLESNESVAAARVMDYLTSEDGARLTAIGIEGRDWRQEGDQIVLDEAQRAKDGFPTEAGDTGAHPLATCLVSWQPQEWQDFSLLYGKPQEFKDWYASMWDNQGRHVVDAVGFNTSTPAWSSFQAQSNELIDRAFLEIVRAASDEEAAARFEQFVADWEAGGGTAATAEIDAALKAAYGN